MKNRNTNILAWSPGSLALSATVVGGIVIGLSILMGLVSAGSITGIIIRDIGMILLAGIWIPLNIMRSEGSLRTWFIPGGKIVRSLIINMVLAALLCALFISERGSAAGLSILPNAGAITYIMLAGVFEAVVFFVFVRICFERSFGIIPGVIAAAFFYSLHHAGFQPEFVKLFFVGLLYAGTVAATRNIFSIFPFFWGVGALWDVLVMSTAVSPVYHPWPRSFIIFGGLVLFALVLRKNRCPPRVPEGGAILDCPEFSAEEYGSIMKNLLCGEYQRFGRRALQVSGIREGAKILEIGNGPGWAGLETVKQGRKCTLTGLDFSPDMVRCAMANAATEGLADRVTYLEGQVEDLSRFPDGSFDAVISRDSLHHWEDPVTAFREINRVLAENGALFITDSRRNLGVLGSFLVHGPGKKHAGALWKGWINSIRASYTVEELRHFTEEAGCKDWTVCPVHLIDLEIFRKTL
ncbi:MAG: class I SAM-dependent methyltransferase [Pontiellaceae bacterium]|nr:class I SAM-dependent methyltransferase [Pontiellaceae bacterium]